MAALGGLLPPDPSRACVSLHSIFSTCIFLFCCSDWAILGDPWVCLFSHQSAAGCPRQQQGAGAGTASACAAPGPAEHQNGQSWGQRERTSWHIMARLPGDPECPLLSFLKFAAQQAPSGSPACSWRGKSTRALQRQHRGKQSVMVSTLITTPGKQGWEWTKTQAINPRTGPAGQRLPRGGANASEPGADLWPHGPAGGSCCSPINPRLFISICDSQAFFLLLNCQFPEKPFQSANKMQNYDLVTRYNGEK